MKSACRHRSRLFEERS